MATTRIERALGGLVLGSLIGFALLIAQAAALYPGGSPCEPNAVGHRFWSNFFCDLTAEAAGAGADNSRAAASARAAFACFALGLAPFFWLAGQALGVITRRLVRALGLVSAAATVALSWLPSAAGQALHTTMVFGAAVPGLVAGGLAVIGFVTSARLVAGVLGALAFACGAANATGYAWAVAERAGCVPWLPVVQKLTALFLVGFMAVVAVGPLRARAA